MLKGLLDHHSYRDGGLAAISGPSPIFAEAGFMDRAYKGKREANAGSVSGQTLHYIERLQQSVGISYDRDFNDVLLCFAGPQLCTSATAASVGGHEWRHNP